MKPLRTLVITLFGAQLLVVAGAAFWLRLEQGQALAALLGAAALMLLLQAVCAGWLRSRLFRPLRGLERGNEIILKTHAAHDLELPRHHLLGRLPEQIHALGDEIARGRNEIASALRTGAERAELQRRRLEQVIQGLEEGVIVCDTDARILLYNPAAHRVLEQHPALGLGRLLYDLLPRTPIEHTLDRLNSPDCQDAQFISAVVDRELLLNCRLGLLRAVDEHQGSPSRLGRGFVLTFEDVTARQQTLQRRDRLFSATLEALRRPLASLRAAAEAVTDYGDMGAEQRRAFVQVINDESQRLSEQVAELAGNERTLVGQKWQLADIYSADLIHLLTRRFGDEDPLAVTMTGIPQWLTTDSYALVALLEHITRFVADKLEVQAFDVEASGGGQGVYLDLSWSGRALSTSELEACRAATLGQVVGKPSADELLQQLGSELWSQPHPRLESRAQVRLPLPAPEQSAEDAAPPLPTRPMIYDFNLFEERDRHGPLMERPLRQLDFVVFDTETTGLHPESGDEVVSIAAVRIVNQRILPDENFNELVNPGRPIPRDSIRYHGITDEQVKDAPDIVEVLPRFKAYAKDAVLVAHNAWFDLAFIRRREAQSGAYFTNPILDTLMLSVCLHGQEVDQSLDGIANRLGIDILGRHSALGDSLATARILLSQIDLLEARGIITLRDALEAYR
ncbi:exonuclease domain-containing protein [Motiliproteus sp. SC1-56]|uniref:3'-5' exonuclease n=1 Tax=Motiliproteus sp. SC1-56 TaxID=2799565 RepID=UPI001A8E8BA0|nr:exonuclease domain-containing protein [Motiliproteus sp. SC1-56]